ncbi:hypothetical protein LE181_06555 [Streptomyces sp. SCA3-4]|uniref:hypothetical protein n=1 Tax=Streptomyces sichuanensis TaxID=2871810 RepID=UPI001CE3511B|nr:hypothetical protein [Streptomyces sichuanensis]MCA6091826.1 hypothetical protein [Streptomyces sichuanensis]
MWTTSLPPFIGVVLGTVASLVGQFLQGRASERAEARSSERERAEARRNERLTHLVAFLCAVQEAERVAVDRYQHNETDTQWQMRARQALDRVWVTQKTIHMVCASEVNEAAREAAFAVQDVIRKGPGEAGEQPQDEMVWQAISPSRRAYLDVAATYLSEVEHGAGGPTMPPELRPDGTGPTPAAR